MSETIRIRRAEPEDFTAVHAIYASPRAQAGTLQLPFPSVDMWRQRLQNVDPNLHLLVACAGDEVVGQLGLHACARPRRNHVQHQTTRAVVQRQIPLRLATSTSRLSETLHKRLARARQSKNSPHQLAFLIPGSLPSSASVRNAIRDSMNLR